MNGEEDSRNREGSASFFFMDCGLSCRGPVRVSDGTGFGPTALSSDAVRACPGYRKAGHVPDSEYRVCVLSVSGFASRTGRGETGPIRSRACFADGFAPFGRDRERRVSDGSFRSRSRDGSGHGIQPFRIGQGSGRPGCGLVVAPAAPKFAFGSKDLKKIFRLANICVIFVRGKISKTSTKHNRYGLQNDSQRDLLFRSRLEKGNRGRGCQARLQEGADRDRQGSDQVRRSRSGDCRAEGCEHSLRDFRRSEAEPLQ